MAKVSSIVKIRGTLHDVVFYEKNGKSFVRKKAKGFGELVKKNPSFAGHRKRNRHLQLANAFATAIYRLGKEFAEKMNYKVHHELVKRIFHVVKDKEKEEIVYAEFSRSLKGLSLNYKDTLPPITTSIYENNLLFGCDSEVDNVVEIKVILGTLPSIKKKKELLIAHNEIEEVEIIELNITPDQYGNNIMMPINIREDQIILVITNYFDGEYQQEWVRIVG